MTEFWKKVQATDLWEPRFIKLAGIARPLRRAAADGQRGVEQARLERSDGARFRGIHCRSDQFESMRLGEVVAIRFLTEEAECYNEALNGFTLAKFDDSTITV